MAASILAIVGVLLPLAVWWIKRRAARNDDPIQQHREHYEKVDAVLAGGDPNDVAVLLHDSLDDLERVRNAGENAERKRGADPREGRADDHGNQ